MQTWHKTGLRAWKVIEAFKKRAPGVEMRLEVLEAIQSFLSLNGVEKTIQLAMESTQRVVLFFSLLHGGY